MRLSLRSPRYKVVTTSRLILMFRLPLYAPLNKASDAPACCNLDELAFH
ncbi:hypothetical protein YPPY66_2082 [Yersinia pestis PY-66]|nr:hypothetical protein YPPY02_1843 [Yersinia pestis PY-02]EIR03974.1 hypothetical protein YPPY04_1873 [Yersinia pestis PY-04]EIR05166.1 hypothetical protein YPPY05_1856 [Yersinia pestis PY-05]EIR07842.1 hypothetical protein YPPY06_1918 [Yersinia pestis PY-06]EIR19185.1 hypothetical protein YPPY07_1787 [Yersinia pestis PY-07]EIR21914.1 hypothetical protein YPPY09_1917 [Yersinia pestis PY-09]EIR35273.1 hypothetical protein YPPY11_1982 [Yersinia pestis PY-11]EIR47908.1 hypothetical protein YPP